MINQTWALFVDSYRELNSKKLFWITLALSAVVVLIFFAIGIDDRGLTFFGWTAANPIFNTKFLTPTAYYKWVFVTFGIDIWLAWIATVLALISTAPVFPDFLAGGAIEMVLSKPISRARLFITKYFAALLFVALQILAFTLASLVVLGIRGGTWDFRILLAVPVVLAFYSFLYCVCALLGVLTRSTIASLLLTILFWFLLFVLNAGDATTLMFREQLASRAVTAERRLPRAEKAAKAEADRLKEEKLAAAEGREPVYPPPSREHTDEELLAANPLLSGARRDLTKSREDLESLIFWNGVIVKVKAPLPKTTETIELLKRTVLTDKEMERFTAESLSRSREHELAARKRRNRADDDSATHGESQAAAKEAMDNRSLMWILGTSFGFEAVILALAAWRFSRRDF